MDGEFRGLDGDQVKVSSVLFGLRSYDARKEVLAVALREASATAAPYEIQLRDRSVLQAVTIAFERGALVIRDSILGTLRVPVGELAAIELRASAPAR